MFSSCTLLPNSKKIELGSSDQKASPLADKNTRVVLVLCLIWKCILTAISGVLDIAKLSEHHLLREMSSQ